MAEKAGRLPTFTHCKTINFQTLNQPILFVIPPFTQLNTPYPATAVLKGFMNTRNIWSQQCDLGIELILALFSKEGLMRLFSEVDEWTSGRVDMRRGGWNDNVQRMLQMRDAYIRTIGPVLEFLQGRKPELAYLINGGNWLPQASRFGQTTDLDHDFGHLGIHDRAKHLATLYLEDISDLITDTIDPHFGFSRYAERLGRSASSFDELHKALDHPGGFIDSFLTGLLKEKIDKFVPALVALSVPFPGNLYSALKCGQWLRKNHPGIKIVMGGGFVNTELRSLTDPRVFEYVDFITLDDGETPLLNLAEHLDGRRTPEELKRTFTRMDGKVIFHDGSKEPDVAEGDKGFPDYTDLPLEKYISVIEVANPMHRLWSDGRWNKLMLAHGCYWKKCTFCDVTLEYIKRFEPNKPDMICDRMETILAQTGRNGFHFTDEAASPALLRELALEILRRKLTVVWWTNIRFEVNFADDLCRLLKESGCIAVSGGLEVASDRILKMINKGVTVSQVARVAGSFTRAGIMVHAYLMYGFPTQTAQETIDSLEVVRQLFMHGVVQSGFWHQFTMTAHSPVGLDPQRFGVEMEHTLPGTFANNDLVTIDHTGCDHESFSEGLKKSLYNYMHGICFDFPLQEWFNFKIPHPTIARDFIKNILLHEQQNHSNPHGPRPSSHIRHNFPAPHSRIIWTGTIPQMNFHLRQKKGKSIPSARIIIQTHLQEITIQTDEKTGKWLADIFPLLLPGKHDPMTAQKMEELFAQGVRGNFKSFWEGPIVKSLRETELFLIV